MLFRSTNDGCIAVPILNAGENWKDAKGKMSLLLLEKEEKISLDFVLKNLKGLVVSEYRLELDNMERRPDKATRIEISAWMNEQQDIHVKVRDCGFGNLYQNSGKEWEVIYEQVDLK